MKVISFGTLKGGTGKTTVAFNVGGILAEEHKVLFIDMDPQSNLTDNVGIDTTVQNGGNGTRYFQRSNAYSRRRCYYEESDLAAPEA